MTDSFKIFEIILLFALYSNQINGIVALIGKENVLPKLKIALQSLSHRAWNGYKIITENELSYDLCILDKMKSNLVIGCCQFKQNDCEVAVHGSVYFPENFSFKSKINQILKKGLSISSNIFSQIDGDFAFAMIKDNELFFGRDIMGIKPLYFAKNLDIFGIASDIKALQNIGLKDIQRVQPGSINRVSINKRDSVIFDKINPKYISDTNFNEASNIVLNLIEESLKRRIKDVDRVIIAFSGGLDSSLIAHLASKIKNVLLLSIYAKNSIDEDNIKKFSQYLGLETIALKINIEDVFKKINFVRHLVEKNKSMDLSLGLGVHFIAENCSQLGFKTIFFGHFADELFGGYLKYTKSLQQNGINYTEQLLYEDVVNCYKNNFERDEKASSPYVDIRFPYAYKNLVNYVLSLPINFKIGELDNQRKLILKEVALKAGLPKEIIFQRKRAFQYSSGINKLVLKAKN